MGYCSTMEDFIVNAETSTVDFDSLPVIVVGVRSAAYLSGDGEFERLDLVSAANRVTQTPHMMVNMPLVARRLGLGPIRAYDVLEFYAFARPSRFCLPTVRGLLDSLRLTMDCNSPDDELLVIKAATERLIGEMSAQTYGYRAGAGDVATAMSLAGWPWGPIALKAVQAYADNSREDGMAAWANLPDVEDQAPPPVPNDLPVEVEEAQSRLKLLLGKDSETREGQQRYAGAATHAFRPREMEDGPNLQLLEAGTGTGKTLGYIAPASVWAEKNEGPVWLATYTKNLQRQLDQELSKLYPDPKKKAKHAVIRKGRENYACLLNVEETYKAVKMRASGAGGGDRDSILMGLVMRWARYSRDGDMIGGDFPSWLGAHFGVGRIAGLTDRRGECLYNACPHYRKCFIEKAMRKARYADLVVANHALVMAQAANRAGDPELPKRLVFDEGHHVFDASDSAFAVHLTGMEGAELRRWLRGKETGGLSRARGLRTRLDELIDGDDVAKALLDEVIEESNMLPGEGWMNRVTSNAAMTKFETYLSMVRGQVLSRTDTRGPHNLEVAVNNPAECLITAAAELAERLSCLAKPMKSLAANLMARLADDADILDSGERGRLESGARSLSLRADMVTVWQMMASSIGGEGSMDHVDWFELDRIDGRERDIGMHRHFIDPTKPFAEVVVAPAHGVLITSATLKDKGVDQEAEAEDWVSADMRTGASHSAIPPKRLAVSSPFDYKANTKVLIVGDVNKQDTKQVAAAYRELFLASNGGGLGLFTAISRLRATYAEIAEVMENNHLPLYAQHVDPIDTSTLVDIFRAEENSCLLGTDAVRDGVDVPGNSLRLIVFDRVPWPRPTLLHKARRGAFGGRAYDEMLTRLKLSQAYGRLVRRMDDRGLFVMLDGATPTRLLSALPAGVEVHRIGLAEAVAETRKFFEKG